MISEGKDMKMKETLGDFFNEAPWPLRAAMVVGCITLAVAIVFGICELLF